MRDYDIENVCDLSNVLHEAGLTVEVSLDITPIVVPYELDELCSADLIKMTSNCCVDELRIRVINSSDYHSIHVSDIEEIANTIIRSHVPVSIVSFEFGLDAMKYSVDERGLLIPELIGVNELADVLKNTGGRGIVRLKNGAARIGYKGYVYIYQDAETIMHLVGELRNGKLAKSRGIHLRVHQQELRPDNQQLRLIAERMRIPVPAPSR